MVETNVLEDLFITKFYGIQLLTRNFKASTRDIYDKLREVYCISQKRGEEIYSSYVDEDILSIDNYKEYEQTTRLIFMYSKNKKELPLGEEMIHALALKGRSLKEISYILEYVGNDFSASNVYSAISTARDHNRISVFFVVAFLCLEGLGLPKNIILGEKMIDKCVAWNNIDGILLHLKYGTETRRIEMISRLFTIVQNSMEGLSYVPVGEKYSKEELFTLNAECKLLRRYFRQRLSSVPEIAEIYDSNVVRILSSKLLTIKEKTDILLSGQEVLIKSINELPLNDNLYICPTPKSLKPVLYETRKVECEKIFGALNEQSVLDEGTKVPLLVSQEKYIRDDYSHAIEVAYRGYPVYTIDFSTLDLNDLENNKGNFVISEVIKSGKLRGVFIIKNLNGINEDLIPRLLPLIKQMKKINYQMNDLGIRIDLRNCVFIAIDNHDVSSPKLKGVFETICLNRMTLDEKNIAIESLMSFMASKYEMTLLTLENEAKEKMFENSSDKWEDILMGAAKAFSRQNKKEGTITAKLINDLSTKEVSAIGFDIGGRR